MKRLYDKNKLNFSLLWIGLYVVLFSLADNFSRVLGIEKILSAPLCVVFVIFLFGFLKRNGLREAYGLRPLEGTAKDYLYFIPLFVIASCNLWNGVRMNLSPLETALYILSMLCVGFIEEIIFRGFLFKALSKDSITQAIVISSLAFGFGHIVSLLNGADFLPTLLQIVYATAIGFLFTVLFCKGKSLWPCIFTHSAINSLSVFGVEGSTGFRILTAVILTLVSFGYGLYIWNKKPEAPDTR